MIQALVAALHRRRLLILWLWNKRGQKIRDPAEGRDRCERQRRATVEAGRLADLVRPTYLAGSSASRWAVVAFWVALPPRDGSIDRSSRSRRRHRCRSRSVGAAPRRRPPSRLGRRGGGAIGIAARLARDRSKVTSSRAGLRVVGTHRRPLRAATTADVRRARRDLLRTQRRCEHRPRRHDADGRVLRLPRSRQASELWYWGIVTGMIAGAALALVHAFISIHLRCRPDRQRHRRDLPRARQSPATSLNDIYSDQGTRRGPPRIPTSTSTGSAAFPEPRWDVSSTSRFGEMHIMISPRSRSSFVSLLRALQDPARAAAALGAASIRGGRYGRHLVYRHRGTARSCCPARWRARRRVSLDRHQRLVHGEDDRGLRLHRSRGADLRQLAAVRRLRRRLLFGFAKALGSELQTSSSGRATWTTLFASAALCRDASWPWPASSDDRSHPPPSAGPTSSNDGHGAASRAESARLLVARRRRASRSRSCPSQSLPRSTSTSSRSCNRARLLRSRRCSASSRSPSPAVGGRRCSGRSAGAGERVRRGRGSGSAFSRSGSPRRQDWRSPSMLC